MSHRVIVRPRHRIASWLRDLLRSPAKRKRRALLTVQLEYQLEKKLDAIKRDVFSWEPFVHRDDARNKQ